MRTGGGLCLQAIMGRTSHFEEVSIVSLATSDGRAVGANELLGDRDTSILVNRADTIELALSGLNIRGSPPDGDLQPEFPMKPDTSSQRRHEGRDREGEKGVAEMFGAAAFPPRNFSRTIITPGTRPPRITLTLFEANWTSPRLHPRISRDAPDPAGEVFVIYARAKMSQTVLTAGSLLRDRRGPDIVGPRYDVIPMPNLGLSSYIRMAGLGWLGFISSAKFSHLLRPLTSKMFRFHPLLFGLITAAGIVELGLTAYERKQQHDYPIGGHAVTSRLDYLLFLSVWTTVTGSAYLIFGKTGKFGAIASFASHAFWLFWTFVMWLIGAALYQRQLIEAGCGETSRRCHINHTVEGFAWIEMSLTFITFFIILLHVGGKTERYRTGPYDA
ncbi:hypothetical protein FRB90_011869 [Tulasnella sp. 427]|nr:hypothetical protein FRB90_011869 [Tulasnella sp. 427]